VLTRVIFVSLALASLALASNAAVPAKQSYLCTDQWLIPDSSSNHFAGGAELAAGKYQEAFNNFDDEVSTAEHAEMFAGQERNSREVAQDNLTAAANLAGAAASMFGEGKNDLALGYLRDARDHLASATKAWPKPITAVAVKDIRTYIDQLAKAKKPLIPDCMRAHH